MEESKLYEDALKGCPDGSELFSSQNDAMFHKLGEHIINMFGNENLRILFTQTNIHVFFFT